MMRLLLLSLGIIIANSLADNSLKNNREEFNGTTVIGRPKSGRGDQVINERKFVGCDGKPKHWLKPGFTTIFTSPDYPNNVTDGTMCKRKFIIGRKYRPATLRVQCQLNIHGKGFFKIGKDKYRSTSELITFGNAGNKLNIKIRDRENNKEGMSFSCALTVTAVTTPAPSTLAPTTQPQSVPCNCGVRKTSTGRIVGGVETEVNEYPWQAGISNVGTNYFCGGSLISPQWILTAAHCLPGQTAGSLKVTLGDHRISSPTEATSVEMNVQQIIVHEAYNSNSNDNDVALLKLSSPVSYPDDDSIGHICLPENGNSYINNFATVTGWGTTDYQGDLSDVLQEVEVTVTSVNYCKAAYGAGITFNMLCAGVQAGGKDSCQGDSGGPLVTQTNENVNIWHQIGVVSFGYGCGNPKIPGVYAKVSEYVAWIAIKTGGDAVPCANQ